MSRNLKVNGPISGYTVDYGNKRYLLMGDYHSVGSWGLCDCTTQLNCMNVVELIKKIADQAVESEKYVDIFLEANTYRTTDINPKIVPEFPTIRNADILAKKIKEAPLNPTYETQWLYQLEKWFLKENCFDINKKECPWYPNVRFHWADPRSARIRTEDIPYVKMKRDQRYVQKGGDGEDFSYELMEKIKTEDDLFSIADALIEMAKISKKFYMDYVVPYKEFDFMNAVEDLVEELEIKESNPYFDDIWTHFFEKSQNIPTAFRDGIYISKIAIQLEELRKENPQLANEIIEYFNKHFDNVIKNIKGYKRFAIAVAKNPKSKPILADNYFKKKIVNSFEWHFTALMDLYALSRMLRKISREGNDSELVIVYAGDYHIGFYANFFEQIDGAKVQKHKNLIEDYISPKNKKLIKKLESFDFNPLELYDIHLKKIPYRCIEFKGFQKPSDFFPRRIKKRKYYSIGGGTFDISQIKDTASSTNKNYVKIVLEESGLKIPGYIVTPDKNGFFSEELFIV